MKKHHSFRWYWNYKLPRLIKFYTRQILFVIGVCILGFVIGTFYPNFIAQNSIEEKAVNKTVTWAKGIGFMEPTVKVGNDDAFIDSMKKCIAYLNVDIPETEQIPDELIIAQAIIESNAGTSRFAHEGNNMFGIRTWNTDEGMLPYGHNDNLKWRVKSYRTKCQSVKDYIRILNTKPVYSKFREIRRSQHRWWGHIDAIELARALNNYSTSKGYEEQVINMIRLIRQNGKVVIKR